MRKITGALLEVFFYVQDFNKGDIEKVLKNQNVTFLRINLSQEISNFRMR